MVRGTCIDRIKADGSTLYIIQTELGIYNFYSKDLKERIRANQLYVDNITIANNGVIVLATGNKSKALNNKAKTQQTQQATFEMPTRRVLAVNITKCLENIFKGSSFEIVELDSRNGYDIPDKTKTSEKIGFISSSPVLSGMTPLGFLQVYVNAELNINEDLPFSIYAVTAEGKEIYNTRLSTSVNCYDFVDQLINYKTELFSRYIKLINNRR